MFKRFLNQNEVLSIYFILLWNWSRNQYDIFIYFAHSSEARFLFYTLHFDFYHFGFFFCDRNTIKALFFGLKYFILYIKCYILIRWNMYYIYIGSEGNKVCWFIWL